MSIHIILGKPGSGKSMYATYKVLDELVHGRRNIVTNLPLLPGKLNEYINQKYPEINTRFVERLRILSDDELGRFWEFRGPPTEDKPNGDDKGNGVAYYLDEAHIAFNARDWATLGRQAIHYMSQHRKLGDIVWPITQSCGNLDKQFRSVAEDYTVLRNEYTSKMGIFRGMGRFVRKSYYSEPQGKAEPFETATFQIDTKGIASCYDTAKGIGVHGSKADIGKRAKGIPIWMIFPAFIAIGLLCVFIPMMGGRAASKWITGGSKAPASQADPKPPETPAPQPPPPPPQADATQYAPPSRPSGYDGVTVKPKVRGYLVRGSLAAVVMDDGSVVTELDGRLESIRRGRVKMDGEWWTPQGPPRAAGNFLQENNTTVARKIDENKARNQPTNANDRVIQSYDGVTQPQQQQDKDHEIAKQDNPPPEHRFGSFATLPTLRTLPVTRN